MAGTHTVATAQARPEAPRDDGGASRGAAALAMDGLIETHAEEQLRQFFPQ